MPERAFLFLLLFFLYADLTHRNTGDGLPSSLTTLLSRKCLTA